MSDPARSIDRKQLVMLIALGVILIGVVYVVFLRGAEPDGDARPSAAPPPLAQAEGSDPFEPDDDQATKPPVETFEVFASRDPFNPVVGDGSGDEGAADPGSDQGSAGDGNTQGDSGDGNPNGGNDSGSSDSGTPSNQDDVQGHTVKLIDVFREEGEDRAQVQIDSTSYTVSPGDVFAENFQLVSVAGQCATMLYGDDQFTLCEGEQILK